MSNGRKPLNIARAALYGSTALVLSAAVVTPAVADEVDEIKMEMQQLLDRMEQLETNQAQTDAAVQQNNVKIGQATGSSPWLVGGAASVRKRATVINKAGSLEDRYVVPQTAQDNGVTGGDFPGSFKLPGSDTSMAIYGLIHASYVWDTGPLRLLPSLVAPELIPTDGIPGSGLDGNANFRFMPSQINIETRTPSEYGAIRTHIQFDWFNNDPESSAEGPNHSTVNEINAGLRLAEASMGPLKVGLHWWAMSDLSQYAETLDWNNTNAAPLGRLPGITWSESVGGGWSYAIGMYDPVTQIGTPGGTINPTLTATTPFSSTRNGQLMPDFAGNVQYTQDWGHIFAGFDLRRFGYEIDSSGHNLGVAQGSNVDTTVDNWIAAGNDTSDFEIGWGVTLSLNLFDPLGLHDRDRFFIGGTYGEGIRGIISQSLDCFTPAAGIRGAVNAGAAGCENEGTVDPFTGELEANTNWAWHAHYQHWWTDTIRSTVLYSTTYNNSGNDFDLPGVARRASAAWGNLIWSPVPRVNLGVELHWQDVRVKANDGNVFAASALPVGEGEGDSFQVQLGAIFLY